MCLDPGGMWGHCARSEQVKSLLCLLPTAGATPDLWRNATVWGLTLPHSLGLARDWGSGGGGARHIQTHTLTITVRDPEALPSFSVRVPST